MTYEKSRATWNSGFRKYKDESPEAKQRRREQQRDINFQNILRLNMKLWNVKQ